MERWTGKIAIVTGASAGIGAAIARSFVRKGLCLCTREAVRAMRETNEDSVVIHVNSLAGERIPFVPGFSIYPASKRAVTGLAQSLQHELTGTRIRVTVRRTFVFMQSISPGLVATEFMASYSTFSEEAMMVLPTLNPDDVATAAIYVLSNPPHVLVQDIVLRPLGESLRQAV